jgi:hypothetical protein
MRHRIQAERNKNLSEFLHADEQYLDWACITAFYSALHFVSCGILPQKYNGVQCNTMEDAMRHLNAKNKHEATSYMVRIVYPNIARDYDYLKNLSYTTRYNNGDVDINISKLCQKKLKKIQKEVFP